MLPFAWRSALRALNTLRALSPTQSQTHLTPRRTPLRRPPLGAESLEVRVVPAGRLFAAGLNTAGTPSLLYELNPTTGAVLNEFPAPEPAGPGAVGLAFDGSHLFYINGLGSDLLYELDPTTGATLDSDLITAGSGNYDGLAVVGGQVFIQDYGANQLIVFDPVSDTVTRTVTPTAVTFNPVLQGGLAGATGPGALIGPVNGGNLIAEFDPATGEVVHGFQPGFSNILGAAVVDNDIYLGSGSSNTIFRYTRSGTFLGQFSIPVPVAALGGDGVSGPAGPNADVVNGGFETGTTAGWTVFNAPGSSTPGFTAYSGPNPQQSSLPAPPEGTYAAYDGHNGPGSYILYQDLTLSAAPFQTLTLTAFYQNQFSGFITPDTLDYRTGANQQFRIDIISPTGDLLATTADVVKLNVFRTAVGDPQARGPFALTADLSAFAGQTVRLRIAVANNQFFLFAGVDSVHLTSSETAPSGTVRGVKFNDLNGNGARDPGEPGLAGWTVYADLNRNNRPDAGEPSTVTGPDGSYSLTLPPGTYRIREQNQGGWASTAPLSFPLYSSGDNGTTLISIDPATGAATRVGPFGALDARAGTFTQDGTYWTIINGLNSTQARLARVDLATGAATPVGGVLWTGSPIIALEGVLDTTLYGLSNSGQIVRIDTATGAASVVGQSVPGLTDLALDFHNNLVWAVAGGPNLLYRVDLSTGASQVFSPITGLGGAAVGLMIHPQTGTFYVTDSTGSLYTLDPFSGQATRVGTGLGVPAPSGGDFETVTWYAVAVVDGQTVDRNFGSQLDVGTVSGVKFNDLNGNGARDPGEPGLAGWTVYADTNQNGRLDPGETTAVTGADGSYTLAGVPAGSYDIRELPQPGWVQTGPTSGRLFVVRAKTGETPIIAELDELGLMVNRFPAPAPVSLAGPQGLADGGTSLFYVDDSAGPNRLLYELDPFTGAVRDSDPLLIAGGATGLAYLNGLVYILSNSNQIAVFDPVTDSVVRTLTPGPNLVGGLTGAGDLGLLFATDGGSIVYAIDPQTGAVVWTLSPNVGPLAGGLAYRAGELIAAPFNSVGSTPLFRINPQTGAVLGVLANVTEPVGALGGDGPVPGPYHIDLAPGQVLTGRDFGDRRDEGTVRGVKFNDLNGNGARDPGEPALPGWTIYDDANNNGKLDAGEASTVTGPDGSYTLTLSSGLHTVREVTQPGWVQTGPTSGRLFTVRATSGGTPTISELDPSGVLLNSFPAPAPVSLAGPQGLADGGTSLFYIDGSAGTSAARTLYELDPFTGAVRDSDTVFGNPSGLAYLNGLVYILSDSNQVTVFDPVTDSVVRTLAVPGTLVGGLTGAGDLGLLFGSNGSGVIFAIDPQTGAVVWTLSPNVGPLAGGLAYRAGELIAAPFNSVGSTPLFRINPQTGAVLGVITIASAGISGLGGDGPVPGPYRVAITPGLVLADRDFGSRLNVGTVRGVKFNDLNGNGARDPGESGLAGWTVYADLNNNRQLDAGEPAAVTGPDGSYSLTVPSGTAYIREVSQPGWRQTSPAPDSFFALRIGFSAPVPLISRLSPSGAVLGTFSGPGFSPGTSQGLADAGGTVFYVDGRPPAGGVGSHTLYELDSTTGTVLDSDMLPGTAAINGLAYLDGLVYALVDSTNQLIVFDPTTDTVVRTLNVPADISGGLTGAGDRGLLYAANVNGAIYAIDPATGAVVRTLVPAVALPPGGLAYLNGTLLAAAVGSSTAFRINPDTGAILGTVTLGGSGTLTGLGGDGAPAPFRVTVTPGSAFTGRDFGNHQGVAPVAADDSASVAEDAVLTVPAPGVLANDTDADPNDSLVVVAVNGSAAAVGQAITLASGSQVRLNADGSYTFIPAAAFNSLRVGQTATDSFTYTVRDSFGATATATVTVTINGANDAPAAVPDSADTDEDTAVTVAVLANDTDVDGDVLTVATFTQGAHGSVALTPAGILYTPAPDFFGLDSFSYTVSDGHGGTSTATVTVTVAPVNDAPTLAPIAGQTVAEDSGAQTVALTGISAGPANEATQTLTFVATSDNPGVVPNPTVIGYDPATGTATLTFAPAANANGTATITVTISDDGGTADGGADSVTRTFTVTVTPVNDAPVATDLSGATAEDTPLVGTLAAADVEGDPLTYAVVSPPAHGTVSLDPATGSFTYTPAANYNGTDTFTFKANDGQTDGNVATVAVTVTPVNDAPVAADLTLTTAEDTPLLGVLSAVDVDGDALTYAVVTQPAHGMVVVNPGGSFTYTPAANYNGTDTFTFKANDGTADSAAATVRITVAAVNDAPTLAPATFTLPEKSPKGAVVGTATGADVDGDTLTYSIVAGNVGGAFAVNPATGEITVASPGALNARKHPTFTLTVQVRDPGGLIGTGTVTIQLVRTGGAPVVIDIQPYGDNRITANSRGTIDVAILSSADFDALSVNVFSLRFGRTGREDSLSKFGYTLPRVRVADVNRDGRPDLVVSFEIEGTGFRPGDTKGILTGELWDGTAFSAEDRVSVQVRGH